MLYTNSDTISFEDVMSNMLSKEKFDHDIHADPTEGLVVSGRTTEQNGNSNKRKNQSKSRNPHSNKTCNYYGKLGHIQANCWKLKKKKEKKKRRKLLQLIV